MQCKLVLPVRSAHQTLEEERAPLLQLHLERRVRHPLPLERGQVPLRPVPLEEALPPSLLHLVGGVPSEEHLRLLLGSNLRRVRQLQRLVVLVAEAPRRQHRLLVRLLREELVLVIHLAAGGAWPEPQPAGLQVLEVARTLRTLAVVLEVEGEVLVHKPLPNNPNLVLVVVAVRLVERRREEHLVVVVVLEVVFRGRRAEEEVSRRADKS